MPPIALLVATVIAIVLLSTMVIIIYFRIIRIVSRLLRGRIAVLI